MKNKLNLFGLQDLLKGRDWNESTEEERLKISEQIVKVLKKGMPEEE